MSHLFPTLKHLQKLHSANLPASGQKERKLHHSSKHDFYLLLKLARDNDSYHTFLLNNPFNFWKFGAITRVHIARLGGVDTQNCISDGVILFAPVFYLNVFQNSLQKHVLKPTNYFLYSIFNQHLFSYILFSSPCILWQPILHLSVDHTAIKIFSALDIQCFSQVS